MNENSSFQRRERLNQVRMAQNNYNHQSELLEKGPYLHSTFGIRMLIAALLFVGYFFLQTSDKSIGFLSADIIQTEVNRYSGAEINIFDFMDNFTYTLNVD